MNARGAHLISRGRRGRERELIRERRSESISKRHSNISTCLFNQTIRTVIITEEKSVKWKKPPFQKSTREAIVITKKC